MYKRIVVPVDESALAWRAIEPARRLAQKWGADVQVLCVTATEGDLRPAELEVETLLAASDLRDEIEVVVLPEHGSIGATIAEYVLEDEGSIVVMSSVGRGRSAALLGSVAEEVLRELYGPIIVLGPAVDPAEVTFEGPLLVCADGSDTSEAVLGAAGAWALTLHLDPWVISVADPDASPATGDAWFESNYPHRLANRLGRELDRPVDFEVLHDKHAERAIVDFAERYGAAMIAAGTHGRTGWRRVAAGSVAASIVHTAPCPVLLYRPPHLRTDED